MQDHKSLKEELIEGSIGTKNYECEVTIVNSIFRDRAEQILQEPLLAMSKDAQNQVYRLVEALEGKDVKEVMNNISSQTVDVEEVEKYCKCSRNMDQTCQTSINIQFRCRQICRNSRNTLGGVLKDLCLSGIRNIH